MSQYTTEPCGGGGDWYWVTNGDWVEGGDMSESTARAVAERLSGQATEIERLQDAVAFLQSQVSIEQIISSSGEKFPPCWQGEAAWWPIRVWKEFERKVNQ